MSKERPACIRLDSNDRFEEDFRLKPFYKLPHNENGFNRLVCIEKDGFIYWKNKPLFKLNEIPQWSEETKYIATFVCEFCDEDDKTVWERKPIMFADDIAITDCWIMVDLDPDDDDLLEEVFEEIDGDSCVISGSVVIEI